MRPFVPNFWNPQAPLEKPDLDRLKAIRFVTGTDNPPFDVTGPDGAPAGFDAELARAICAELAVPCTVQARPRADVASAVTTGAADAAIASLPIDDRAPGLTFTAPYFKTPARFVMRLPTSLGSARPADLKGKRVAVQAGTPYEAYLARFFPDAVMVPYSTAEAERTALKAGAVDAVFADAVVAAFWLDGPGAAGCCAFAGGAYTESRYFGPGAGIAVRQGNDVLRRAIDDALARIAANGTYADIYLRFFPISPY